MSKTAVSDSWQNKVAELRGFIKGHPEIRINSKVIAIPNELRADFYQLFDTVGEYYLNEAFSHLVTKAENLSGHYKKIESELNELLGLKSISMLSDISLFLHQPAYILRKQLRDLIFGLLRDKTDSKIFQQQASNMIESTFYRLYYLGYEKWVTLSLLKLLNAEKVYSISMAELQALDDTFHDGIAKRAPLPERTNQLHFEHNKFTVFIVPDFIIYSGSAGKYIAMIVNPGSANTPAEEVSRHRRWISFDRGYSVKSGILIYVDDRLNDLALIADVDKIAKPDIVIDYIEKAEQIESEKIKQIKLNNDTLEPRLGTYVISDAPLPQQIQEKIRKGTVAQEAEDIQESRVQGGGIHFITTGFNEAALKPIAKTLIL